MSSKKGPGFRVSAIMKCALGDCTTLKSDTLIKQAPLGADCDTPLSAPAGLHSVGARAPPPFHLLSRSLNCSALRCKSTTGGGGGSSQEPLCCNWLLWRYCQCWLGSPPRQGRPVALSLVSAQQVVHPQQGIRQGGLQLDSYLCKATRNMFMSPALTAQFLGGIEGSRTATRKHGLPCVRRTPLCCS